MKNTHIEHPEDTILTGDLSVLDCFAGSGVTGDEALKLNRKIGLIEISQKTIDNYIKPRIK